MLASKFVQREIHVPFRLGVCPTVPPKKQNSELLRFWDVPCQNPGFTWVTPGPERNFRNLESKILMTVDFITPLPTFNPIATRKSICRWFGTGFKFLKFLEKILLSSCDLVENHTCSGNNVFGRFGTSLELHMSNALRATGCRLG